MTDFKSSVWIAPDPFKDPIPTPPEKVTPVERVKAWREKNRERYNEYQKNLMRKRRAK